MNPKTLLSLPAILGRNHISLNFSISRLLASLEEVCGGSHDQCAASPNEDDFPWSSVTNGLSRARHVGSGLWHTVLQRAVMFWLSTSYLINLFRSWKRTHTVSCILIGIWLLLGLTHAFTHVKDKGFPAAQPTAELLVKAADNKMFGSVVSGTVRLVLAFSSPLCSQFFTSGGRIFFSHPLALGLALWLV